MKRSIVLITCIIALLGCKETPQQQVEDKSAVNAPFVKTNGTRFEIDGKPYRYLGANFWAGMNLGAKNAPGDRARLIRELNHMQKLGINNLRIMAITEGPDTEPFRIVPSNNDKGNLKEDLLVGLDFLLAEMKKRDMYAVVCLTNFWPWSGGMAQYARWANAIDSIHYPMDVKKKQDWNLYMRETAKFYSSTEAMDMFTKAMDQVITRKNTITGINYIQDPTIMSWELCNEPRGINNISNYLKWVDATSTHIRSLDTNHLITTGSEGITGAPEHSGVAFEQVHALKNIDYTCAHIWIQNFGWYDPKNHDVTYPSAQKKAFEYFKHHAEISKKLNKPYVLEEFGIMKDNGDYYYRGTNKNRDQYYTFLFESVYQYAKSDSAAGANFWAWGGEGRAREVGCWWKPGDDFTGDPPHEEQGWYSVYNTDTSTHKVIKKYTTLLSELK